MSVKQNNNDDRNGVRRTETETQTVKHYYIICLLLSGLRQNAEIETNPVASSFGDFWFLYYSLIARSTLTWEINCASLLLLRVGVGGNFIIECPLTAIIKFSLHPLISVLYYFVYWLCSLCPLHLDFALDRANCAESGRVELRFWWRVSDANCHISKNGLSRCWRGFSMGLKDSFK